VKIFTLVVALLLGGMAGLILTAVHQSTVAIGSLAFPWAAIAALLIAAALIGGLRIVFDSRVVAVAASIGLVLLLVILASPSKGGSVLVANDLAGNLWTYGAAVVVFIVLAWPRIVRRDAGRGQSPSRPTGNIDSLPAAKGSSIQ
jgi:N-acetyl-1-D-myo-inositol-2-amino-2-deoxy-alpha-D-glucopyranoside deacetylase